jgi:uncharacterized protein YjbJ (UPF0337 family)
VHWKKATKKRRPPFAVGIAILAQGVGSMNWDQVEGNWKQFRGKAQQQWGKLTGDDLDVVAGKRDELAGRIQQRYGIAKDEAEKEIDEFTRSL